MIGQSWSSEVREFRNEKTGRTIRQLTSIGNNVHLYFTENSFDAHQNRIIFRSDRASGEDKMPYEDPLYNLFSMDLETGEMAQLTGEAAPLGSVTKTPDSHIVVYSTANKLKKLNTESGEITVLYEETENYNLGGPSISCNRRYIAFCRNEKVNVTRGPNYTGFKERYYMVKVKVVIATTNYTLTFVPFPYFQFDSWRYHPIVLKFSPFLICFIIRLNFFSQF